MPTRALPVLAVSLLAGCSALHDGPAWHPRGVLARGAMRLDADGGLPRDNVARMIAQRERVPRALPQSPPGPRDWRWLGPGNVGGRVRAILIHPSRPNEMWIGSASGGVWRTTDGGARWAPQDGFPSVLPIGCLTFDPGDPYVIYAGTGEGVFDSVAGSSNLAAPRGSGIYVTRDGGRTWSHLRSTSGPEWYFVDRIAFSADGKVMLAATGAGIQRSLDRGRTWSRRTTRRTTDVDFHPTDPKQAIAGTIDGPPQYSNDGGLTWRDASGSGGPWRSEVAYARSDPRIVYAAVARSGRIRIRRSTDGGRSYALRTTGGGIRVWSRYNVALWVDPRDAGHLWVGGVNLYRSTNGGVTLARADRGVHPDHHAIVAHPAWDGATNQTLVVGHDGGVSVTANARAAAPVWRDRNHDLGITQFYGAAIHGPTGVVLGGTQDNGTLRYHGDRNTWSRTFGGDGGHAASDPTNANVFYGEYQNLRLFRSENAGRSATVFIYRGIAETRTNFIPFFTLDPNDPKRMLAAGSRLWRSHDVRTPSRPVWTAIKPALSCPAGDARGSHFAVDPPCNISTIAVARGNSNVIRVGHNNGRVYKTRNGLAAAPSWTRVDGPIPDRGVSSIVIDPRDHDRVYVTIMGYHPDGVWRTTDGGRSWKRFTGTGALALPAAPATSIALHPVLPGWLYVGTDVGLFWSTDDGATWITSRDGAGIAPVEQLVWKDRKTLMVVTHGRGIHLADTADGASVRPVGRGCGRRGPPALTLTDPVPGATQTWLVTGASPGAPASIVLARGGPRPFDLGGGCVLRPDGAAAVVIPFGASNVLGVWSAGVPIPRDPSTLGATFTGQVFFTVPAGPVLGLGELSGAATFVVGLQVVFLSDILPGPPWQRSTSPAACSATSRSRRARWRRTPCARRSKRRSPSVPSCAATCSTIRARCAST